MKGLLDIGRGELLRWALSAAAIVGVHAACAAALVHWRDPVIEPAATAGAIFVELAPEATSAPAPDVPLPPGPQQVQADAAPPPPDKPQQPPSEERKEDTAAEQVPEPIPELPKVQTTEVSLAAPALTHPPDPPRIEATAPPAPETTAPQAIAAPIAAVTAAPVASVPTASNPTALPQWSNRIAVLLERNKRYPATARARREEGTTRVAFVLDRQGRLVSSRIEQSSGIAALDQEALDLLRRAQPFPALPAEVTDTQISLTVPIKFALR